MLAVTMAPSATATFEALRPRLFGLAYRMLGSRADAEDVVQDTYVRWHNTRHAAVDNPEAWLVTSATRLAIDRLRRLKTEREAYVGPWLPDPIVSDADRPDRALDLSTDLSMAALTLLETLAPDERAAFLLHDVFDVGYDRIASILGKNEAACRQLIHRARTRVRGTRKRFDASDEERRRLLERFKAGVESSDEEALLALFAPDATWTADGGGKVPAGTRPIHGAAAITRLLLGIRQKYWAANRVLELVTVNGEPGVRLRDGDRVVSIMAFEMAEGRIASVYAVLNPDKIH
jgi:RNA polymerase sigma-70 factor (ECF subfamily)